MSYAKVELDIIRFAEKRGLIKQENQKLLLSDMQLKLHELTDAIITKDKKSVSDAIGGIGAQLIILCVQQDLDFTKCLEKWYESNVNLSGKPTPLKNVNSSTYFQS